MRQIIVLEKQELKDLSRGQTMTLNLPSGETVQIQGESSKRFMKEEVVPPASNGTTEISRVKDFASRQSGKWFLSREVKESLGKWGSISQQLKRLAETGILRRKPSGTKPNGETKYAYQWVNGAK